jgi:hypothetical protein
MSPPRDLDHLAINTIGMLVLDGVQKASTPMEWRR